MGTPDFAVPSLEALSRVSDLCAVFTQPDREKGRGLKKAISPVKEKALELGIPVHQPSRVSDPEGFSILQKYNCDFILVVAYGQILKSNVIQFPKLGCFNVHASLLPRWRGAAPIHFALWNGDTETGVTLMKINEKLDAGDMLAQLKLSIRKTDTTGSLHDRLAELSIKLIEDNIFQIETLTPVPQNENEVTYAHKLTKKMSELDLSLDAVVLERQIRSLNPWPGAFLFSEGLGRLKILEVKEAPMLNMNGEAYLSVFEFEGNIYAGLKKGALRLVRLQLDGKRAVLDKDFINGLRGHGQSLPFRVREQHGSS